MIRPFQVAPLATFLTAILAGSANAQCQLEQLSSAVAFNPLNFGEVVTLSSERAVISTFLNNERRFQVFERFGTDWFATEILTPRVGTNFSHVMDMDKDTVAVGLGSDGTYGEVDPQAPSPSGEVDMFDLETPGGFVKETLLPSDAETGMRFGSAIAISDTMMAIGAPGSGEFGVLPGSVYIFELQNGHWTETAKLQSDTPEPFDGFGSAVELDGNRLLVTGGFNSILLSPNGVAMDSTTIFAPFNPDQKVYVYERRLGQWFQTAKLEADTNRFHSFGRAMAVSDDTIMISAMAGNDPFIFFPFATTGGIALPPIPVPDPGPNFGVVFIYEKQGPTWQNVGMLRAGNEPDRDDFGVSLDAHGDYAVIGSPIDFSLEGKGAAFAFKRTDAGWRQAGILNANLGDEWNGGLGRTVAITDHMAIVGAPQALAGTANAGKAFVYGVGDDCSGNGRPDACDIASGDLTDTDGDLVPDICETGESSTFCEGSMNSLGMVSLLDIDGELSLAKNQFSLRVVDATSNQFGLFLIGNGSTHMPFGAGMRCVGGFQTGQFAATSSGTGEVLRDLDLTTPMVSIAPYTSWNFQYAYRDAGQVHVTNAVHVTFMP